MSTDLPLFNKCCLCAPLRLGILVWAYLKLVFDIIILSFFLLGLFFSSVLLEDHEELLLFLALYLITIIILIFDVIFDIVLINGLHKKNVSTLRLYSCYGSTYIVVLVIYFLLSTGFILKISVKPNVNPFMSPIIYVAGAIVTFVLILHCYLLILIHSEIRKLNGNAQLKFENCTEDLTCKKEPIGHV